MKKDAGEPLGEEALASLQISSRSILFCSDVFFFLANAVHAITLLVLNNHEHIGYATNYVINQSSIHSQ